MNITVSLDWEKWDHKPSDKEQYKDRKDRLGNIITESRMLGSRVGTKIVTTDLKRFVEHIATKGQTWSPYIFNPCPITNKRRRRVELFDHTHVLALDFDSPGVTVDNILERCKKHNLTPNVIHESFSSTESLRKYRAIFVLEETFYESLEVDLMIRTLLDWFPDADPQAKDLARIFFGSNSGVNYFDDTFKNTIEIKEDIRKSYQSKDLSRIDVSTLSADSCFDFGDEQKQRDYWDDPNNTKEQKSFIKNSIMKAVREIQAAKDGMDSSRYKVVFTCAERLTGIKYLTGYSIHKYLLKAIKSNTYFNDWEYDPSQVILSAIMWKATTPNIMSGRLYEVKK